MLRFRSVNLPIDGWGRVDVTEADTSFDEPGEPKTGPRTANQRIDTYLASSAEAPATRPLEVRRSEMQPADRYI